MVKARNVGIIALTLALLLGSMTILATAQEPVRGGTLDVAIARIPPHFDTHLTTAPPNEIRHLIVEPLVVFDADFEPQPILAASWEVSDDQLSWTFSLREGVTFHDGTPLTAADVVASLERYLDVGVRAWEFERVDRVEAVDDYTVVFHLSQPWAALTESLAMPSGAAVIYPEWVVDQYGTDQIDNQDIVGTGPYQLAQVVPGERYVLTRYDNYQSPTGEPSFLAGARNAYADEITFRVITEDATRTAALLAGDVDIAEEIPREDLPRLQGDARTQAQVVTPGFRVYIKMNTNALFADEQLRKAVQAAVDLEGMMAVYGPEELWRVNPTPRFQAEQWMWHDNAGDYFPNDMELARTLVEASSYDGETVRLLVSPDRVPEYFITPVLEETLRNLGLNVETIAVDSATFSSIRQDVTQWDIKQAGGGSGVPISYLASSARDRAGNLWSWITPEWDHYLNISQVEVDPDVRANAVFHLNRIIAEGAGELWVGDVFSVLGSRADVRGLTDGYKQVWVANTWLDR